MFNSQSVTQTARVITQANVTAGCPLPGCSCIFLLLHQLINGRQRQRQTTSCPRASSWEEQGPSTTWSRLQRARAIRQASRWLADR